MTTNQDTPAAEQDGQAPEQATPESSPAERVMGALALAAAIGLAFVGLDMLTGGALFPAVARIFGGSVDDG